MDSVAIIRTALGIELEAVGVKYTDDSPDAELVGGRYAVCNGILGAAMGKVIMLSRAASPRSAPNGVTRWFADGV